MNKIEQREKMLKIFDSYRVDPAKEPDIVILPDCPVCNGLGVVYADVPVTHPDYARLFPCPKNCEAVQNNRVEQTQRLIAGMEKWTARRDKQFDIDFEGYSRFPMSQSRQRALIFADDFVRDLSLTVDHTTKRSLFFTGDTGTGKTCLSSAIVNELERKGETVFFARVAEIIKSVQSCYAHNAPYSAEQMKDFYAQCPVLAMDEFDMHGLTDDKKQIIEDIIDYRYRKDLPTIGTTNLTHDQLWERWGDRTADRLIHMAHWFRIDGKLRNQQKVVGG